MAELWKDGFDHYGSGATGVANALSGAWAGWSNVNPIGAPAWGAATGPYCMTVTAASADNSVSPRRVLPAAKSELIIALRFSQDSLPSSGQRALVSLQNGSNVTVASLYCTTTGQLVFERGSSLGSGTVVASSQGPVLDAGTWQHVEMRVKVDGAVGTLEVRVNGEAVIGPLTELNTGASLIAQLVFGKSTSLFVANTAYIDDLIVRDTSGTRNNDFEGDLRVVALYPNADTEVAGWTPRPRKKIGNGILDNRANNNSAVSAASSVSTDIGNADFTIETFIRFYALPTGSNKACIFGKWDSTNNRRSYQLYLGGPDLDSGYLTFRISTDGQAGTVAKIISWPWVPELDRWYHLAISRASGETLLFIDGVQYGIPQADANTYFAGTEPTAIGGQVEGTSSVTANTAFNGFLDELRLTIGYARYTAEFTPPTTAFGRNVSDDPHFANVALLCGFDSGINDESSYGRLLTARNGSVQNTPDDGVYAYQTINQHTPRDDTFVEAALVPATGTFTLSDLPTNGKKVTVGTKDGSTAAAYTFKTALSTAFDVLIGADVEATVANLTAAINHDAGEGTAYGTGTTANFDVTATQLPDGQMLVTASTAGTAGNSLASTTDEPNASWGEATLGGGQDIPGPSEFSFDRLPADTTVVKSVSIITRNFKSDAGTCKMQTSFVGPQGAATTGAEISPDVNPSYHEDVFEADPDTTEDLTPTTIIGGRVRLNRTE